jgi:Ca2+-binding EF-hand superfamily protein
MQRILRYSTAILLLGLVFGCANSNAELEQQVRAACEAYDTDNDGTATEQEIIDLFTQETGSPPAEGDAAELAQLCVELQAM